MSISGDQNLISRFIWDRNGLIDMRVLAISGSPLKNGNTSRLINAITSELEKSGVTDLKIKTISLAGSTIRPCKSCRKCIKEGHCVLKSDDFSRFARQMKKSDLIIIGSPVYFHDVNGPVKNMIDRSYSLWHKRQLKGKKVIPVAVCADSGDDRALETLKIWAQAQEMKIIRTVSGHGYKAGEVLKDQSAIGQVKDAIKTIAGDVSPKET
ncbi:MAG: flavodoxin family protein [Methanospirillum sp.]|uniref:flavodoxin family protein n=1 Tax=Methanospirillum sp. TaxID=45200 RepID=UPI00237069AB|nr:flavodoxin family protein [Methanospirillum sp.]MDD1727950.1 flavodoxin family protein [Methanospirillum sp.]